MKLVISTQRLVLREFVPGDADALATVICDPETMQYYPAPFDQSAVVEWIARNRARYETDGYGLWGMVLTSKSQLIGDCGLIRQQVDGEEQIEIGYHVRRDHWGQGLATEAARACRDYGFRRLGAERLISLIRPENLPSRRVAEKVGMTLWKTVEWRGLPHYVYAVGRPGSKETAPPQTTQARTPPPGRASASSQEVCGTWLTDRGLRHRLSMAGLRPAGQLRAAVRREQFCRASLGLERS